MDTQPQKIVGEMNSTVTSNTNQVVTINLRENLVQGKEYVIQVSLIDRNGNTVARDQVNRSVSNGDQDSKSSMNLVNHLFILLCTFFVISILL